MTVTVGPGEVVYGLRELQIAEYDSSGNLGAWNDLPGKTLTFRIVTSQAEQRANDQVVAVAAQEEYGEFEIEAGLYPLAVMEAIFGGALTTTGSGATLETTLKKSTSDERSMIAIRGRAIGGKAPGGTGGGDMVITLWSCLADGNMEGTLQDQNWLSPAISGKFLEHATEGLMSIKQRATAASF